MRVTIKGQVTIPKDIRDHLGITAGSDVAFVLEGESVRLVAVDADVSQAERDRRFERALDRLAGTVDPGGMTADDYMQDVRGPRDDLHPDRH